MSNPEDKTSDVSSEDPEKRELAELRQKRIDAIIDACPADMSYRDKLAYALKVIFD